MKILGITFLIMSAPQLWAGPKCFDKDNSCDPDLMCTFKAEWHSKALLYVIYATNDASRKNQKKPKDGIYFDGTLLQGAMNKARAAFPDLSGAELNIKAGQIFEDMVEKESRLLFEMPVCEMGGKLSDKKRVKDGYNGMFTNEKCEIWVDYNSGQYDPKSFGSSDNVCDEFYQRDYAHEQIHQRACKKKAENSSRFEIQNKISEELQAYKHSMQLNEAQYRLLSIQCSTSLKKPQETKKRMDRINQLLKGFESRGGR